MDSTVGIGSADATEARSDGLGEKRPAENGDGCDLGVPSPKKAKRGGDLGGNMKKVAEIVLVLAAMGKIRAGRSPTAAEKEMMAEARGKLAEVCEGFAPKDVFPRDAFGVVIEDLGLNKLREQRLGYRPPKLSISEKLLVTKQKMERSEEFSLHSGTYASQRVQANSGAAAENRGTSHLARVFTSDKQGHASISSGGFQPASPLGHVSAANSTSLPYQLPASEVKSSTSGLPPSNLGKDSSSLALPRVERAHFRLDGRSNGSYLLQANSSGDHLQAKTPTWSLQPPSASSSKIGSENKVPAHTSMKVEGTADSSASRVAPQLTTPKPSITQTTSGNVPSINQHVQGMNIVRAPPLNNSHNEIGRIVQKLLQPQLPKHPKWTPPSRDYMNKALTCQVCKDTINEVDNVLVCDSCEKGYHLKCIQSNNQKGIPRGEWHCGKCLMMSNGKPLPPKYGRVMRNVSAPKVATNTIALHSSPDKKVGNLDEKVSQRKVAENGNSGLQSASSVTIGNGRNHSASNANIQNAKQIPGNDLSSSKVKMYDKPCSGTGANNVLKTSEVACVSPARSSVAKVCEVKLFSEPKGQLDAKLSEAVNNKLDDLSQPIQDFQDNVHTGVPNNAEIPPKPCRDEDLEKSNSRETSKLHLDGEIKQDEQRDAQANTIETSGTSTGDRERSSSSSDGLPSVDWIGDVLQVVEEKTYYQSCCVNGIVYKLQDYTLVCSNNSILTPSKLLAMWEDQKTRIKWVNVCRCYFPGDLPEAVGRPCTPEINEVYEANHVITVMAGMIQGPCEVLPASKFAEENERRVRSGTGENDGLRPVFLCKWFFDESKGVFRDVSS